MPFEILPKIPYEISPIVPDGIPPEVPLVIPLGVSSKMSSFGLSFEVFQSLIPRRNSQIVLLTRLVDETQMELLDDSLQNYWINS